MEPLKLIELMFKHKVFFNLKCFKICFEAFLFFLISNFSFSQNSNIKLCEANVIQIENSFISASQFEKFNITLDTINHVFYTHIGFSENRKSMNILKYSLVTKKSEVLIVHFDKEIDFRYGLYKLGFDYYSSKIYFLKDNTLIFIDALTLKTSRKSQSLSGNYVFYSKDTTYIAKYYRSSDVDCASINICYKGNVTTHINLSQEDVPLTSFAPFKLISKSDDYLFWCHVSRPILYRYNTNLHLIDSLVFDFDSNLSSELKLLSKYSKISKRDPYTFYMQALEDTLSINTSVQLLNDTTCVVTTEHPNGKFSIYYIHFDSQSMSLIKRISDSNISKFDSFDDFYAYRQESNGTFCSNKLYFLKIGKSEFPWEEQNLKKDYSKYTYFNLYIFDVK